MKKMILTIAFLMPFVLHAQVRELSLEECLDAANSNNVYLKNAHLDVLSAQAQRNEARWEFFPKVSLLSYGYRAIDPFIRIDIHDIIKGSDFANNLANYFSNLAYMNGFKPYFETAQYGYGSSLTALQPVYAGGRIRNGNKLAGLGVEASKIQYDIQQKKTSYEIEEKYWFSVALQEKMKTLEKMQTMLDAIEKDVTSAVNAGVIARSQLIQVQEKQKELSNGFLQLRSGLKLAKMDLFNAAGIDYDYFKLDSIMLVSSLEAFPEPLDIYIPQDSMKPLQESRLLEIQEEAKKLEKAMSVGELLPKVLIGADYGYNNMLGDVSDGFNGVIFGMVQIPITDIGKAAVRAKRYDYAVQKAANEREYLDEQLVLLSRKLFVDVENAWDAIAVSEESVKVAEENEKNIRADYEAGRDTLTSLLQAESATRTAREELIDKRMEYRKAVMAYQNKCEAYR
ncbi:MAG: TolC family protein [Bacteroidales bacterium]|nr:TolC family protein [Bacteroidales bacterium]